MKHANANLPLSFRLRLAQRRDCLRARACAVDGLHLHMQWCSFILGLLSLRECKHRPLARLERPQRGSLGLILVPLGRRKGPAQERERKIALMVKGEEKKLHFDPLCKDPLTSVHLKLLLKCDLVSNACFFLSSSQSVLPFESPLSLVFPQLF